MKKLVLVYKSPDIKLVECLTPCWLCVSPPVDPSEEEDISGDGEDIPIIGF